MFADAHSESSGDDTKAVPIPLHVSEWIIGTSLLEGCSKGRNCSFQKMMKENDATKQHELQEMS